MTKTREWTDPDGDTLSVDAYGDGEPVLEVRGGRVILTRSVVSELVEFLQADADGFREWSDDLPDATADGYDWPARGNTVTAEAEAAVYGDRGDDYGHPRDHWTRTAVLVTGLLQHKLAEGEYITPEDWGRMMVAEKLARDVHTPKRDNRVDGAGYFLCLDRLETGK